MGLPLKDVIQKLESFAPLNWSEPWDNVGLLIEPCQEPIVDTVLLTIDLTEDVVEEAIDNNIKLIVCYHPNIFKPLKTVIQTSWKERIISKCLKHDIAVFSSHTTWDPIDNGIDEWLAKAFDVANKTPIDVENKECSEGSYGIGRFLTLKNAISLKKAIQLVKEYVGVPYVQVGIAKHMDLETPIATVAICAGCGSAVLCGVSADLYLTGEMLHHEVLEATQSGVNVILCNHSDSERGFLTVFQEVFKHEGLNVVTSKVDKDCLQTM